MNNIVVEISFDITFIKCNSIFNSRDWPGKMASKILASVFKIHLRIGLTHLVTCKSTKMHWHVYNTVATFAKYSE